MIQMTRFKRFGIGGIMDFAAPLNPQLPPMDFPLDAGSLSPGNGGGADGGGEPAPAPSPGAEVPVPGIEVPFPGYVPQPTYLFPVQEDPTKVVVTQAPAPPSAGLPTWAIATGAALAGIAVTALLMRKP